MGILSKFTGQRDNAITLIRDIARRAAAGKPAGDDPDKLAALLPNAGKTEADFRALVEFYEHHAELVVLVARSPATATKCKKAHEALERFNAETERSKEERQAKAVVPTDVMEREQHRRNQIFDAARQAAYDEWGKSPAAVTANGDAFKLLTWRQIVERGWNVTLAAEAS